MTTRGTTPAAAVDACCVINLYAAGEFVPLLRALELDLYVPQPVVAEAIYIRRPDDEGPSKLVPEQIDLKPAISAGLLRPCELQGTNETTLFVQLASALDDGEAACLAIAKSRGWLVATDDRKARRLAGELGVGTITTPELVKQWAETTEAPRSHISSVLRKIRTFARFAPPPDSSLYEWWVELSDEPGP